MVLRVSLLGRFAVSVDGQPVGGFDPQKVQELFSYLLLFRGRPHHREVLASILWESCEDTAQAKKYLRKTLWQLQNGLAGLPEERFPLVVDHDWIELAPGTTPDCDIDVLNDAFAQARRLAGRALTAGQIARLQEAVDLYRGDLLEGVYHNWCLLERQRYHFIYMVLLDKLIDHCLDDGLYDEGFAYGLQILQHDPAREHTHRQMMWLRCLAGDRTGALRQFEWCAALLQDELGVTPSQATRELYDRIRADDVPRPPGRWPGAGGGPGEDGSIQANLVQIQDKLDALRQEMGDQLSLLLAVTGRLADGGQKPTYGQP